MAKHRKKKYVLSFDDLPSEMEYSFVGIKTSMPSYQVAYELNRLFVCDFHLYEKTYQVERGNMKLEFSLFHTSEDEQNNRIRLLHNESLVEMNTPGSLFSTEEAFYLFPEIKTVNYLLFTPQYSKYTYDFLKENYKSVHLLKWIDIDLNQIKSPFPIFRL